MTLRFNSLVAALLGCGAISSPALAQSMPEFKFSGFGTVSAVHSSDTNSDFVGTIFQPSGAGHTHATSTTPDTKLGAQVGAVFNDKLSAVVQVVSQYQYDNSYQPMIEWANLKYQLTPELSMRAGRIAAPSYLLSESRFVNYTNAWVRPPIEVYGVLSITSNDGVDATYRSQIGSANNAVQVYYGRSSADLRTGKVTSKTSWGVNDSVEMGSLMLRAGYSSLNLDLDLSSLNGLFAGMRALNRPDLAEKYSLRDMQTSAISLGATYDPGNWFVMGELLEFKSRGFLSDMTAWYVSGGYRIGKFTPYVSYASLKSHIDTETGAGPLNGGINTTLNAFTASQATSGVGLRWDVVRNVALKAQYDRVKVGDNSHGRFTAYPGFVPGSKIDVATVSLDFVF